MPELARLSPAQLSAHLQFLRMEIKLEDLREACKNVLEFDFSGWPRTLSSHFLLPEPAVLVSLADISRAKEFRIHGLATDQDLIDWSTMILLNDAYEIEEEYEDGIAEWLHDTSFNLHSR